MSWGSLFRTQNFPEKFSRVPYFRRASRGQGKRPSSAKPPFRKVIFLRRKISGKNFLAIPTLGRRFPAGGTGIKKKPYNRGILRKNLIIHGGHFFETKNLPEKFSRVSYFRGVIFRQGFSAFLGGALFRVGNSRRKFFDDAYFRGTVFPVDFSLFLGGHFFGSIFWGKIFSRNCSAHIAKNPGGHRGRGFRGPGSGGYLGGYTLDVNEKPPASGGFSLSGGTSSSPHQRGQPQPLGSLVRLVCFIGLVISKKG